MATDFETRGTDLWPDADFEIRMAGDGLTLEGYAAVFDKPSLPMPGPRGPFTETLRSGAMTKTLAENPDVTLRYQHNLLSIPLGRTKAGTLELSADSHGLHVRNALPDNEIGRPIRDAVKRGDISGMSFSFRPVSRAGEKWNADYTQRDLLDIQIGREVSVVDFPAYPDTSVMVRHLADVADLPADELAEALALLRTEDARLTVEQRNLIYAAVAAKSDEPFVGPRLARARERLAALAS